VSARVLNKPGPLSPAEWSEIARHPVDGAVMAEPLRGFLGDWVDGIGQHHERFDGRGYPDGRAGKEICLAGRITAVTDSFECMTAVRSYHRPKTVEDARAELVRCAGTDFDPALVRAFLGISLGRVRWTVGVAAWVAELPLIGIPTRAAAEVATHAALLQPSANAAVAAVLVTALGVATPLPVLVADGGSSSSSGSGRGVTTVVESPASTPSVPGGGDPPSVDTTPTTAAPAPAPAPADPGTSSNGVGPDASGPPGHGGSSSSPQPGGAPGLSRVTPGRDDVPPPGHGGTPPGHTGIQH
jgi:HD domain